jgi:hypothetical protein
MFFTGIYLFICGQHVKLFGDLPTQQITLVPTNTPVMSWQTTRLYLPTNPTNTSNHPATNILNYSATSSAMTTKSPNHFVTAPNYETATKVSDAQ